MEIIIILYKTKELLYNSSLEEITRWQRVENSLVQRLLGRDYNKYSIDDTGFLGGRGLYSSS